MINALRAVPGMLNGLGSPVVVYDRHSLRTTELGQVNVEALVLTAPAGIGATSLAVEHSTGARMAGRLPAGLVLTVGAVDLVLAAEVVANGGTALSLPVPALAAALADGAVVALARARELPYIFRPRASSRQFMPGSGIVTGKVRGVLTWSLPSAPVEPPEGALLNGEEIFKVDAIAGGSAAWRVEAGAVGG